MSTTSTAWTLAVRGDGRGTPTVSSTASAFPGGARRHVGAPARPDADLDSVVAASGPKAGTWSVPVPCVAHPCAGMVHIDGPCQCFVGGPAPVHAGALAAASWPR